MDHLRGRGQSQSTSSKVHKIDQAYEIILNIPACHTTQVQTENWQYKDLIATFAAALDRNDCSLQKLTVSFDKPSQGPWYPPWCVRAMQHLLEPLASLKGHGLCVTITGVTSDFEAKMMESMSSNVPAITPGLSAYRT